MLPKLNEHFYYTRRERIGLSILLFIIISLWISPSIYRWYQPKEQIDFSAFEEEVIAFRNQLTYENNTDRNYSSRNYERKNYTNTSDLNPFLFNPNTASLETLTALGLNQTIAERIINFRNKGGYFNTPEDLSKIYGLAIKDYEQLMPYIQLEQSTDPQAITASYNEPYLFDFDPNQSTKAEFEQLGLPERTINSIINYRNKGGQFRSVEDFKKIYNLSHQDYERLVPFIKIEDSSTNQPTYKSNQPQTIDINLATIEDWKKLKGIGNAYAQRILKFRDALGGFVHIQQITEVYGFPDSTYQNIEPYLVCNNPKLTQIDINEASSYDLKNHPYLDWEKANAIVNYRNENGRYSDTNIISTFMEFDDGKGTFLRVKPYLKAE